MNKIQREYEEKKLRLIYEYRIKLNLPIIIFLLGLIFWPEENLPEILKSNKIWIFIAVELLLLLLLGFFSGFKKLLNFYEKYSK